MFLTDEELAELIAQTGIFAGLADERPFTATSQVQPSSIDLRVGAVYRPETRDNELGCATSPMERFSLPSGGTAVVETLEQCCFPNDVGAVAFPPSSISSRGLLMTDPGHVDPGYTGTLSFTVINMSSEPFELRREDKIISLLVFKTRQPAKAGYAARKGTGGASKTPSLLRVLSRDFLDIETRAKRIAANEEARTRRWSIVVPGSSSRAECFHRCLRCSSRHAHRPKARSRS